LNTLLSPKLSQDTIGGKSTLRIALELITPFFELLIVIEY